jgi:hypothetical protein
MLRKSSLIHVLFCLQQTQPGKNRANVVGLGIPRYLEPDPTDFHRHLDPISKLLPSVPEVKQGTASVFVRRMMIASVSPEEGVVEGDLRCGSRRQDGAR